MTRKLKHILAAIILVPLVIFLFAIKMILDITAGR